MKLFCVCITSRPKILERIFKAARIHRSDISFLPFRRALNPPGPSTDRSDGKYGADQIEEQKGQGSIPCVGQTMPESGPDWVVIIFGPSN